MEKSEKQDNSEITEIMQKLDNLEVLLMGNIRGDGEHSKGSERPG